MAARAPRRRDIPSSYPLPGARAVVAVVVATSRRKHEHATEASAFLAATNATGVRIPIIDRCRATGMRATPGASFSPIAPPDAGGGRRVSPVSTRQHLLQVPAGEIPQSIQLTQQTES